uniref:Uncharacterized protein n=1 Tax=Rhizophora mucronata TaxID=61149 RepID=A0A2P2NEU4_RHIMU
MSSNFNVSLYLNCLTLPVSY